MAGFFWVIAASSVAVAETASFPAAPSAPAAAPPPAPPAAASPPAPPEVSPAAAPADSARVPSTSWAAAYERAYSAFTRGEFAAAASSFAELAPSAPTSEQSALCRELAGIAEYWSRSGLTLTMPAPAGAESLPRGVHSNERTTDEISILYLNAVVYGLGTGVWLAANTEPDTAAGGVLPALGFAGAAAGAVALIDHSGSLHYGVPASAVTGMYIGLEEGITWSLWNQAKAAYSDEWQGKTVATVIWGSATAGLITGAIVGDRAGTTPGRASYVGSTALWGGVLTGLFVASATGDDRGQRDDAALLGAALGTNIGALGGVLSAGPVSPSVARVRFIDLGGIAGGLLAGGLYVSGSDSGTDSNVQGFMGVTALGIAGGLALSTYLTKDMAADRGVPAAESPSAIHIEPTLLPVRGGTLLGALGTF